MYFPPDAEQPSLSKLVIRFSSNIYDSGRELERRGKRGERREERGERREGERGEKPASSHCRGQGSPL